MYYNVSMGRENEYFPEGQNFTKIKHAKIDISGSADIVSLVSGKKIRVLAYALICAGATTVKFQSGGSTDLTGDMSFPANGGISCSENKFGWFETVSGEKLNIVLGSAVAVDGHITYLEI